jgi:hypothetical protein
MSTFKKGDVVKVKAVTPEGPITKMRMDEGRYDLLLSNLVY